MDAREYIEEFNRLNTDVIRAINEQEPTFLEEARKTGYICPFCYNGSGETGDGIVLDKNNKKSRHYTCFACKANGDSGYYDIIDLFGGSEGITKYTNKVKAAASYYGYGVELPRNSGALDWTDEILVDLPQRSSKASVSAQNAVQVQTTIQNGKEAVKANTEPINPSKVIDYTEFYNQCHIALIESTEGRAYLEQRGIDFATARYFWLGFCPDWKSPTALRKGYNPSSSPRLIIPVSSNHYIARDIRHDLTEEQKKYAKQNEIGNGRQGITNIEELYKGDVEKVFLVEGALDAASIVRIGARAAALNSTANATFFLEALKEKPTKAHIILALDNDKAGKAATETLRKGLQQLNISYTVADINNGYKDANEALVADMEAFKKAVEAALNRADARAENTADYIDNFMQLDIETFKKSAGRKSGFKWLDDKIGSIYAGLYLIAGGTSLGKTTLALQLADQLAEQGSEILYFSLEQSKLELVTKSLSRLSYQIDRKVAFPSISVRQGQEPYLLPQAIESYKEKVGNRVSIIESNFNCTPSFIGEYVRKFVKRTGEAPVVFIDYMQVVQPDPDENGRIPDTRIAMKNAALTFKRLTRELNITIILISSISRANYYTPIGSDSIKEAGDVEFTCDVIWGLQPAIFNDPVFDNKDGKMKEKRNKLKQALRAMPRQIELSCLKNRNGINNFSVYFDYYPRYDLYENRLEEFKEYAEPKPVDNDMTLINDKKEKEKNRKW